MSAEDNKALARNAFDAFNQRNWPGSYWVLAPDIVLHSGSQTTQGLEAYRQRHTVLLAAFPDLRFTIEDLVAEEDRVVARYTAHGTQTGAFTGIPPTGKQFTVPALSLYRLTNGKVIEDWTVFDELGMLQQLGVLPGPR